MNCLETLLGIVTNVWSAIAGEGGLVPLIIATPVLLMPLAFVFARKTISATKALMGTGGARRGR